MAECRDRALEPLDELQASGRELHVLAFMPLTLHRAPSPMTRGQR